MNQEPDIPNPPLVGEEIEETVSEDQITELVGQINTYLSSLFKKTGVMEEEAHRPILKPEEYSYINHTISTCAHLLRYWLESPSVSMPPPEALTFAVESLRQVGIKFESSTEDIVKDKYLLTSLLNRAATSGEYTSRLNPVVNKKAVICARDLVNLMPVMAAYNGHRLPSDYSVEISLNAITQNIVEVDENDHKLFIDVSGLKDTLAGLEPDSSGHIRLDESRRLKLESILKNYGIAVNPPKPEDIQEGIESARKLVGGSEAEEYLGNLPFIRREILPKRHDRPADVFLERPIYINPDSIAGANSFDSWKGQDTQSKSDDMGDKKSSLEVIIDYATRGTPLPASELVLFVQEDGSLIVYAENSHRVAAAKLRSEPVAVDLFRVYK